MKNYTLFCFLIFSFCCLVTTTSCSGEKKSSSPLCQQQALSILNTLKIPTLSALQKEKKDLQTSPIKNRCSLSKKKEFLIKPDSPYLKKIINPKHNREEIKESKPEQVDNKTVEEKIMEWFFEQGIHAADPERIKRDLEEKNKEKLLGRFELQPPPILRKN